MIAKIGEGRTIGDRAVLIVLGVRYSGNIDGIGLGEISKK
jgi:hypothetical protein